MCGVCDEMSHFCAEVFPDDSAHVMNQIYQILLQDKNTSQRHDRDEVV